MSSGAAAIIFGNQRMAHLIFHGHDQVPKTPHGSLGYAGSFNLNCKT